MERIHPLRVGQTIRASRAVSQAMDIGCWILNVFSPVLRLSIQNLESDELFFRTSIITLLKHKMYYNLIWQRIQNSWVLPEEVLRGEKDLETIIAIRIARDGQIVDIRSEKKSGNLYLDKSALPAIKKANPLCPLPPGFQEDKFNVGVRFTPSGL